MKSKLGLTVLSLVVVAMGVTVVQTQPVVTLDSSTRFQTIHGWECVAWAAQERTEAYLKYREELLGRAIDEAGITRVRLEVRSGAENTVDYWTQQQQGLVDYATWRANRYATVNDNDDPLDLRPEGYHFSELDNTIEALVAPLRRRAALRGVDLVVNLNYVAFTSQITTGGSYHHQDAEEYAEFLLAVFLHMDQRHGFVPDAVEILLEPDNVSQWNGTLIGQAIVAVDARLKAAGYACEFIAPSCTNMGNAIRYFDELSLVPGALGLLDELSYHRYGGVSEDNLRALALRGQQNGLRTSMLEWWSSSNGPDVFFDDLLTGANGVWEHGVLGGPGGGLDNSMALYRIDDRDPAQPAVLLNRQGRMLRQVYRYVRPGAVRVAAMSDDGAFEPLAFLNSGDEAVVIVKADRGGAFGIAGLPAGVYARCYATPDAYGVQLEEVTVVEGGVLPAILPRDGLFTAHLKSAQLRRPVAEGGEVRFVVASLLPEAALAIERSEDPAGSQAWVEVGRVEVEAFEVEWSGPRGAGAAAEFYRAVFR